MSENVKSMRTEQEYSKIIEDFMLLANETVAEDYFWQEIPFVYRTHDKPDSEKIKKLSTFINNFGYAIKTFIRITKRKT